MVKQLHEIFAQVALLYPEIILASLLVVLVLLSAFSVSYRTCLAVFILGMCGVMIATSFVPLPLPISESVLVIHSSTAVSFKYLFASSAILTAILSYKEQNQRKDGLFLALLAMIVLGMNLTVSTNHLLLLYLGLEVVSVCSYLLMLFTKTEKTREAVLKYFLIGATTSGIMLYGISLLYGFTGSLSLVVIAQKALQLAPLPFYFACILTLTGVLFKVVAVPLHTWVGDVYEGTATSFVAFLTTGSKFLGIAVFYNILQISVLYKLPMHYFVSILAIASLLIGTLGAIWQQNVKRLLAYSSVAHSGFLLALLSILGTPTNAIFSALLFYLLTYLLLSYGAFYSILLVENERKTPTLQAFAGIGKTQGWFGMLLLVIFMGFAGLPPTAGFTAKLLVFMGLLSSYGATNEVITVVLLAVMVLTSLFSLYFYLKIPYYMFFKQATEKPISTTLLDKLILGLLGIGILLLFFKPMVL